MAKFDNWRSPIVHLSPDFPSSLIELPFTHQLNLRGDTDDPKFVEAIKSAFGLKLPTIPNEVSVGSNNTRALWLSPSEWLLVSDTEIAQIGESLIDLHVAATDVSANRIILSLSGPYALDILMKSCELDLHPRAFKTGQVVQTLIAKSQAIIEKTSDDSYHIYVRNSFAAYVCEWLMDAHKEYN